MTSLWRPWEHGWGRCPLASHGMPYAGEHDRGNIAKEGGLETPLGLGDRVWVSDARRAGAPNEAQLSRSMMLDATMSTSILTRRPTTTSSSPPTSSRWSTRRTVILSLELADQVPLSWRVPS
jgi:hypothetical protein